ncbi:winged helix-turn-helix domain-containing protein [Methanosarcina hadiensis]|uniref:helix-turn-helix transcriptional regulator n=1 Tax=Methanosarcina hadiensis TaxID=3078083 RepID=UPI0039779157
MKSSLITVLLSSEKRTDLLLFLKEKPRGIEEIISELNSSQVSILPQLKRLKESGLIVQEDKAYSLSLPGKILVRRIESLVKAFSLLEGDYDYWSGVKSGGSPLVFLKLMEELMALVPDQPEDEDALSENQKITEAFRNSKQILLIMSECNLYYPEVCIENAKKGLTVSIIFTQPIFEKFTEEFKEELDTLSLLENFNIYVLGEDLIPPSLIVTDRMVSACFSSGTGDDKGNNTIVIFGEKAVNWGKETFEYFRTLSKPLNTIPSNKSLLTDHGSNFEQEERYRIAKNYES